MCISWTVKCLILLMHSATVKFILLSFSLDSVACFRSEGIPSTSWLAACPPDIPASRGAVAHNTCGRLNHPILHMGAICTSQASCGEFDFPAFY